MKKIIMVLGMGGTIAGLSDSAHDNIGYKAGKLGIDSILEMIPVERRIEFDINAEQVAQLDSKDMSFPALYLLAQRVNTLTGNSQVAGIVITHGTDTLEESAYFLQEMCNSSKPVVLTCAMRPASSTSPDGPQNVLDALALACCANAAGVFVVCAGRIHSASLVQKNHPYRLDPFSSGDASCHGFVEEGHVRFLTLPSAPSVGSARDSAENTALPVTAIVWPNVQIVMNFVGVDGQVVDALAAQGVDGIVVAGTGNGTIHYLLEASLLRAQDQGVAIVVATRCAEGRVLPVPTRSFLDSAGLNPVKARIALILKLLKRPLTEHC